MVGSGEWRSEMTMDAVVGTHLEGGVKGVVEDSLPAQLREHHMNLCKRCICEWVSGWVGGWS